MLQHLEIALLSLRCKYIFQILSVLGKRGVRVAPYIGLNLSRIMSTATSFRKNKLMRHMTTNEVIVKLEKQRGQIKQTSLFNRVPANRTDQPRGACIPEVISCNETIGILLNLLQFVNCIAKVGTPRR